MKRPIITILTDFGVADHYVAAMKGVILGICPDAQLVDITHEIAPFQVAHGAWMLSQVWRCFPQGTVHLAVVDPGVGSKRRPLLAEASGHFWVAPDNGLLTAALHAAGPATVREITASRYFRQPVSRTFHGRDVFAPVAATLACGVPPELFGTAIADWSVLPPSEPIQTADREWQGEILWIDHFGNIVTSFDVKSFGTVSSQPFQFEIGGKIVSQYEQYYGGMRASHAYLTAGSGGYLELSINQQHAASVLDARPGQTVRLCFL